MTEELKPPFHVKAIAPYTASSATELSLTVGLELEVLGTDGRGVWWQAQKPDGSGIGWFPASYVQVVESQPTPAALPPPPVLTAAKTSQLNLQVSASTDSNLAAPQSARSLTGSGSGKEPKKKKSANGTKKKKKNTNGTKKKKALEKPPEPSKPLKAEKGTTPCSVKIQLVSAELKAEVSKEVPSPAAFIYMREVLGDKDGRKAFATAKQKKTLEPNWNEAYQLDVTDAESEIVAVRVCSGEKPTTSKGKYYGEVTFPLRGAVRDFDSPSYQYKWYDLLLDNKEVAGRIRVFIQYIDTRVTSAPTNFKHESHVGWTADGGFDISNIPGDWKELFKSIGLTKHDLQENSSLAKEVFEIMNNAATSLPLPPEPIDTALLPAPLPLPVTTGVADLPLPPPPIPTGIVAPTPPPLIAGGAPPPPPPPPAPVKSNVAAPPPPPPQQSSGSVSSSGSRSSFLDDVKKGAVLRPVQRESTSSPAPAADVTSVLKMAMERHRKAMAEMPEPGGGDGDWSDWSDDEDEDDGDD